MSCLWISIAPCLTALLALYLGVLIIYMCVFSLCLVLSPWGLVSSLSLCFPGDPALSYTHLALGVCRIKWSHRTKAGMPLMWLEGGPNPVFARSGKSSWSRHGRLRPEGRGVMGCYGLCVPSKFIYWNPDPQCRGGSLWEVIWFRWCQRGL